ncbi:MULTISPECIES: CRISPR-associated endoribonuclease Cas6 [Clostridium]
MRIKIDFYVNENFKFNKNLNEAMTAFIYRCISLSDKRYGAMLHDKGYRQCGYKKFVYHVYSLSQNGSCVKDTLNRGMATLILSSTLDKTIIHFTRGLIRIGKVQLLSHSFDIISIKNIDEPKYTNSMMAKIKSPIFLQDVNHRYLKPGNMEDKLVNNLLEKYYSMYEKFPENMELKIKFMSYIRQYVKYKRNVYKGYIGIIAMQGSRELIEMAYEAGLGSKNGIGFGLIEKI